MVRKLLIASAVVAAVMAGSTATASAMHSWHGGKRAGFAARPFGFHERRFAFHHFPFFRDRFAFYGVGYPYTEDCFAPVWTPWGWRWSYMCY
jgi:hypothetical protein